MTQHQNQGSHPENLLAKTSSFWTLALLAMLQVLHARLREFINSVITYFEETG